MRETSQGTVPAHQPKETIMANHTRYLHQARRRRLHRHLQDPQLHRGAQHRPGRQDVRQCARSPGLCRTTRYEVGAGWSQVAKSSGETYVNLKIAAPEFGPYAIYCRLVKLEKPAEDGATHMILWEPRDR